MFEKHIKRTKFLLILQYIAVAILAIMLFTLLYTIYQSSEMSEGDISSLYIALLPILPLMALSAMCLYGLLKKKIWSLKLLILQYSLQLIGFETTEFSLSFSSGVQLPISISVNGVTLTLDLLAMLAIWFSYTSLKFLNRANKALNPTF
ncbi:hypothetical protein AB6C54_06065 [Vibrio splendidus]